MKNKYSGLQGRFLTVFLLILIIPCIAIGIIVKSLVINQTRDKMSELFNSTVDIAANEIEDGFDQIKKVSDYFFADPVIKEAVHSAGETVYQRTKDIEQAYATFDNFIIAGIFEGIISIRFYDLEKLAFTYSVDTTYFGFDDRKIIESEYFEEALTNRGKNVWVTNDSTFTYTKTDEQSVALFRAIKDKRFDENIGVFFISVKISYMMDSITEGKENGIGSLYLIKNDNIIPLRQSEQVIASVDDLMSNDNVVVIKRDISAADWQVVGVISEEELLKDINQIWIITAVTIALMLVISGGLWFYISRRILSPVHQLTLACQKIIQKGDMSLRVAVQGSDEVTILEEFFNQMLDELERLLEEALEKQNQIKLTEYKALQAQITPHFLYNTLNSIKWLAVLKRTEDVQKAIECLGRLLKNTTSKTSQIITLRQEITNLNDYLFLQELAYPGSFVVTIDIEEKLLDCVCMKFLLQPIVENSIFHGINPKKEQGTVKIAAWKENEMLCFEVKDDGVGMSASVVETVLEKPTDEKTNGLSKIGIYNIHQRLMNVYGSEFGLTVESEIGRGTTVRGKMPYILRKETEDDSCYDS